MNKHVFVGYYKYILQEIQILLYREHRIFQLRKKKRIINDFKFGMKKADILQMDIFIVHMIIEKWQKQTVWTMPCIEVLQG
jgi:hypothetical protein